MVRVRPRVLLALLGVLLVAAPVAPAAAQSRNDLVRENERLRQEVRDLRAEVAALQEQLAAARAEAVRLEGELAAAREAGGAGTPGATEKPKPVDPRDADPDAVVTVDESKPEASPRAVRAAVERSLAEAMVGLDPGPDARSPARINYLREARLWARRTMAQTSLLVDWIVLPTGADAVDRGGRWELMVRAVDPVSFAELGEPFPMLIDRGMLSRLRREAERGRYAEGDRLRVKGRVQLALGVDPTRLDPGPFDNPPLIGPFVTFEMGVEARTLVPADEKTAADANESDRDEETGDEDGADGADG